MKKINGMEVFTRNEASKMTNVPVSSLLFWEKQGLLKVFKEEENGYRYYTNQDLLDVIRLNFYRSVCIPILEIKKFPLYVQDMKKLLNDKHQELEENIKQIQIMQNQIQFELSRYDYIECLSKIQFRKATFPFKRLIRKKLPADEEGFAIMYANYLHPMYQVYFMDKKYAYLAISVDEVSEDDVVLYEYDESFEQIETLFIDKHEDSDTVINNLEYTNEMSNNRLLSKLSSLVEYEIKTVILEPLFPIADDNGIYNDYYKVYLQAKKK